MGTVLGWPPVVWAMRVALFVVLVGCSYVYLLLITPFFRPANIRRMVLADLPRVRTLGAEIAGNRAEVELAQDPRTRERGEKNTRSFRKPVDGALQEGADDDTSRGGEDQR